MENLRAFMVVNSLKDSGVPFNYYPADMDMNSDTCQTIIDDGFYLAFTSDQEEQVIEGLLGTQHYIRSYKVIKVPTEAPVQTAVAAAPAQPETPAEKPDAAPAASTAAPAAAAGKRFRSGRRHPAPQRPFQGRGGIRTPPRPRNRRSSYGLLFSNCQFLHQ